MQKPKVYSYVASQLCICKLIIEVFLFMCNEMNINITIITNYVARASDV